jgi:hypothetical protein
MTNVPDALTFMQSVAGYTQQIGIAENPSANAAIRLAVIDPSYVASSYPTTLPRVTFEGEDTVSDKRYLVVSRGYMPDAGDRVVMLPVGHTYVILGCISPSLQPNLQRADQARRVYMENTATINATNGQTETTTTVSYGYTFSAAPKVLITWVTGSAAQYIIKVNSKTTTNFVVGWRKADGSAFGATAQTDIDWLAIGT